MNYPNLPWYCLPQERVAYYAPPKAGSQTLLKALLKKFRYPDPGMGNRRRFLHRALVESCQVLALSVPPPGYTCVGFIRDPRPRFDSLWRNKCRDKGDNVPTELWDFSPQQLLDYVTDHLWDNAHWSPQCAQLAHADIIYTLEYMREVLALDGIGNESPAKEPLSYNMDQLDRVYALDWHLYENASSVYI